MPRQSMCCMHETNLRTLKPYIYPSLCCVCTHVSVCMRERDRERDGQRGTERGGERKSKRQEWQQRNEERKIQNVVAEAML